MPPAIPNNGRTTWIESAPRKLKKLLNYLKLWAMDIGARVAAGKNVMVFYPFVKEKENYWFSMRQLMAIICDYGNIDMESDTVMHCATMDDEIKLTVLGDITAQWQKRAGMRILQLFVPTSRELE